MTAHEPPETDGPAESATPAPPDGPAESATPTPPAGPAEAAEPALSAADLLATLQSGETPRSPAALGPAQQHDRALRRVTRLGIAGVVWGVLLAALTGAGIAWVLVASSAEAGTELQRNWPSIVIATLPAIAAALAAVGALVIGRRRAAAGSPRPWLLPLLVLVLLAVETIAVVALGATALAVAAFVLAG